MDGLAGRWKRLGGALLDGLVLLGIIFPIAFIVGIFEQAEAGGQLSLGQNIFLFILGLAAFLIVNGYLLHKHGQTVGKKIVGIRIVDAESRQIISVWKVFGLRLLPLHLISQIPLIGGFAGLVDSLFIFRDDKRCIHDFIAGTIVVEAENSQNQSHDYTQ